jgi:hypothetical protein
MPPGTDEISRRMAEGIEAILYGTYRANDAAIHLRNAAYNSFILRRGLIYVWWDDIQYRARFRSCTPDNFYPVYDGDEIVECIYASRRRTVELQRTYPQFAGLISDDPGQLVTQVTGSDLARFSAQGQTTVIDWFDAQGNFARLMGDAFVEMPLGYGFGSIPFVEFPCYPVEGEQEPMNLIDQLVELNQYLDQLLSQRADVLRKYSNPPILDEDTGQAPELIKRAIASDGSVIPMKRGGNLRLLNWEGTPADFDTQYQAVMDTLYDLAGKPRSAFGQTVTNQSGVVTNLTLTPTLQSNEDHETVWGHRLQQLNEMLLRLWESFSATEVIEFKGYREGLKSGPRLYQVSMTGQEIGGWYENRIKWPSAIRTDDPVYVQNQLSQLQSQPPALSLYTFLENMGVEDVEAELDRIAAQLEDVRLNPQGLETLVSAVSGLQGATDPAAQDIQGDILEGVEPTDNTEAMNGALEASGSPFAQNPVGLPA